jgi:hypothetical protein
MVIRQREAIGMLSLLLLLPGCGRSGPPRAEVVGTVYLNDQPVESGAIQFIPVEGTKGSSTGAVIARGKYQIPLSHGPMVGKNRVELHGNRKSGRKIQSATSKPGTLAEEIIEAFPADYNTQSTLMREIKVGVNTLDFRVYSNDRRDPHGF